MMANAETKLGLVRVIQICALLDHNNTRISVSNSRPYFFYYFTICYKMTKGIGFKKS